MRRVLFQLSIILFLFLMQTALFRFLQLDGVAPNLLLIPTVSFGIMRGRKEGLFVGFVSGLLVDIFYGSVLGPYALLYMYLGYINGFFHRIYYIEDVLLPMLLVGANDLVYSLIVYIAGFLLRSRLDFGYYFIHIILKEILFTMLFALVIYKPLVALNKWLKQIEEGSVV